MPESNPKKKLPRAKSYTSIYDIYGGLSYHMGHNREKRGTSDLTGAYGTYGDSKCTNYVTSEKYNILKDSSCKTVVPSTSTIFYDLDDIAKRHSFNCLTEISISNGNIRKIRNMPPSFNGFAAKSTAIVQECATQIHPKLLPRDSIALNTKKLKKKLSRDAALSSEIFLRDNDYLIDTQKYNYCKDITDRQQRFWSYAKYRTEYTKPMPEEKKSKKKDKGKRTEDPCPCQLFSYACPCSDKKSLTELARNSKSLTVADEITSTTILTIEEKNDLKNRLKKQKREDKPTNTSIAQMVEVLVPKIEPVMSVVEGNDVPTICDNRNVNKNKKVKSRKKSRRVLCPNCKEKVDIVFSVSTTEEEENSLLKYEHSSVYRSKEISSTTAYAYKVTPNCQRSKTIEDSVDLCLHDPRCELLPVCQILPDTTCNNINHKCVKKHSVHKSATPRIIRITKACRHHPPCTVVPSCQRANVLKNNCEYIPPCLHRPRCVNLPLCVPFSKSLHYEETSSKLANEVDTSDCPHIPKCKFNPVCRHDSLSNTLDHQINMVSHVQKACEYLNGYNSPNLQNTCEYLNGYNAPNVQNTCEYLSNYNAAAAFLLNQKQNCVPNSFSPCQLNSPCTEHSMCRSNKSCQFNSSECKNSGETKDNASNENEMVIFIRDVGCQFRNKSYCPKESLQSKMSSNSFDLVDVKMGNYYQNMHTLRYEDKFTSPPSGGENSITTGSMTSAELDSECPSHGRRANRCSPRNHRTSGFVPPGSTYVTAYSTLQDPYLIKSEHCASHNACPVKSRRSFLKGKYRNMFSVKRRRKSRMSNYTLKSNSRKTVCELTN